LIARLFFANADSFAKTAKDEGLLGPR
jgi:hypothetical protein